MVINKWQQIVVFGWNESLISFRCVYICIGVHQWSIKSTDKMYDGNFTTTQKRAENKTTKGFRVICRPLLLREVRTKLKLPGLLPVLVFDQMKWPMYKNLYQESSQKPQDHPEKTLKCSSIIMEELPRTENVSTVLPKMQKLASPRNTTWSLSENVLLAENMIQNLL